MPRTKYIAVFFAVLVLILLITFICFALRGAGASLTLMPTQRAMAIESMRSDQDLEVTVVEDGTREENRQSLIEKLRNFIPPPEPVIVSTESSDLIDTADTPSVVIDEASLPYIACANGVVSGSGISSWGTVNVIRAEGARVITSLSLDDSGVPLHTLQLTDSPLVTGQTGCLPEGVVGIALDGRTINAGAPFQTSAEGIAGYALDGFGLFGAIENGTSLTSEALDECHGHVHPIVWNDVPTSMYHYHVTADAPYTLSCFRGTPSYLE